MRNEPELWIARGCIRFCATTEQAQEALRLMAQHGATPAEIADAAEAWDRLHDASVTRLYTSDAMGAA